MASQSSSSDVTEPENLRKIFLGGLNRATTVKDLMEHFQEFGTVKDCVVICNSNKESKGFGFVTMATIEETDLAIHENDGGPHDINNKKVEVKRAIPKDSNIPPDPTNQLFVKNLGTVITEDQLRDYFSKFATVKSVKVIKDRAADNKSKGFGFVELEDVHAVDKIAIMEKHPIEGRTIYCMKAEDRSNKEENWYGRGGQGKAGYSGRNQGRAGANYGGYDGYGGYGFTGYNDSYGGNNSNRGYGANYGARSGFGGGYNSGYGGGYNSGYGGGGFGGNNWGSGGYGGYNGGGGGGGGGGYGGGGGGYSGGGHYKSY